jgi:hypothetical protein
MGSEFGMEGLRSAQSTMTLSSATLVMPVFMKAVTYAAPVATLCLSAILCGSVLSVHSS